jgi:hypothetical protein
MMSIKIFYAKMDGEHLANLERQLNELQENSKQFAIVSSVVDESGYLFVLVYQHEYTLTGFHYLLKL